MAHHVDPVTWHAVLTVVELAGDLLFEDREQAVGLTQVPAVEIRVVLRRLDGPAVRTVVALVPPAVEDAAVQRAVEGRLHAARPARLERAAGRVQPDVAAVVHRPGDRDVVVGEEHEPAAHVGLAGELLDALDQLLAGRVGWMGLAGEHELHGAVRVMEQAQQPLGVRQQQRRPLVRGEPAGEADREATRVEDLGAEALPGQADELVAAVVERRPRLDRVDVTDARPSLGIGVRPLLTDDTR